MQLVDKIGKMIISTRFSKRLAIPIISSIWLPKYTLEFKSSDESNTGKLVITFDVETANDFVHWLSLDKATKMARVSRRAIIDVKKLSEQYLLPMTWLCTGHALLDSCRKHRVGIFKWATPKIGFDKFWSKHDWFHFDPGTDWKTDLEWYFGDVIFVERTPNKFGKVHQARFD